MHGLFSIFVKTIPMRVHIIIFALFICVFGYSQDKDSSGLVSNITSIEQFKYELEHPVLTDRNESLGLEAGSSGYGTSYWDKYITYEKGMDLDKKRKEVRDSYIKDYCKIIFIILVAIIGVIAIVITTKKAKEKRNPWNDSSFTTDY